MWLRLGVPSLRLPGCMLNFISLCAIPGPSETQLLHLIRLQAEQLFSMQLRLGGICKLERPCVCAQGDGAIGYRKPFVEDAGQIRHAAVKDELIKLYTKSGVEK